jgi:hypothetical protein
VTNPPHTVRVRGSTGAVAKNKPRIEEGRRQGEP